MFKYVKIILFFIFFTIFTSNIFRYENSGFLKYQEHNGNINFECKSQCFIFLGKKGKSELIKVKGIFEGNGIIGYGFLNGNQIIPGEFIKLGNNSLVKNYNFLFNKLKYYSQLGNEVLIVFIIEGIITGNDFDIKLGRMSFSEKIKNIFDDFLRVETLTPYSINLRYGVMILGVSIIKIFYVIFILIGLIFIFNRKLRTINNFIILGVILFLFIGFRNLYNYLNILNIGLNQYTFKEYENKTFFDLGDYIVFTDKIRKKLGLDTKNGFKNCKIYIESFQDWPFKTHWTNLYLKPCDFTTEIKNANYRIYYKKQKPENINGKLLINFNDSYFYFLKK